MSKSISSIQPKEVFTYFEQISKIPRGSGNEKNISDYLMEFAKQHNLNAIQDEALNVIIKKDGTCGYEDAPIVILQGHMDMVCEKNKNTEHNFSKDPIKVLIEDDMLTADGTTLGADNGIAIAYCLAILSSDDIQHPPLEVLFTTQEEVGLIGASKIKAENLKGHILINIDSEDEGVFLVSCSGGIRSKVKIQISWCDTKMSEIAYLLKVRGLKGGHSGMDINRGRANSNKLMGRILNDLFEIYNISLVEINGGSKMNAIPREADAIISVKEEFKSDIINHIEKWNEILTNELSTSDSNVRLEIEKLNTEYNKVFSFETTKRVISALLMLPNGVQTMSMDIEGLVESSTNLGVVETNKNTVIFGNATRSSVRSLKYFIVTQIKTISEILNGDIEIGASYPEWQYKKDSYIRELFIEKYKKLFGILPEVSALHAGLECGILSNILGDIDMISFGPNMYDVHTPSERLSILSTQRTWNLLLEVLKDIK